MVSDYTRQTVLQRPSRFITETSPDLYDVWQLEEEVIAPRAFASVPAPDTEAEEMEDEEANELIN
jgi:hypothetical protein